MAPSSRSSWITEIDSILDYGSHIQGSELACELARDDDQDDLLHELQARCRPIGHPAETDR